MEKVRSPPCCFLHHRQSSTSPDIRLVSNDTTVGVSRRATLCGSSPHYGHPVGLFRAQQIIPIMPLYQSNDLNVQTTSLFINMSPLNDLSFLHNLHPPAAGDLIVDLIWFLDFPNNLLLKAERVSTSEEEAEDERREERAAAAHAAERHGDPGAVGSVRVERQRFRDECARATGTSDSRLGCINGTGTLKLSKTILQTSGVLAEC
ncbi:hypothetical protein Q8A73_001045 [Channa argus]|nr:hypothetical protein Q8A73_001045 [Channa argus]